MSEIAPEDDDVELSPWMRGNGAELHVRSNEAWVCLYVPGNGDFRAAQRLWRLKVPFFLPLGYDRAHNRFCPIWWNYIFCRTNAETLKLVERDIKPTRMLRTLLQDELLEQLRATPAFVNIRRIHRPLLGAMVWINAGPLSGQRAYVTKPYLVSGDKVEVSIELVGKWHQVHLPIKAIDNIVEAKELLPLRFKVEEQQAMRDVDVNVCEINRELIAYLDKHPNFLYTLSPRRFELVVADILAGMGYEVKVTPPTKDGGADILAVLRTRIGPILTVVECKRYDKTQKVGVDIIERFLFSIREHFKASCGLIATTSFFTRGALAQEKAYHWQLVLKDFNAIKGWLGSYGNWVGDNKSGLWVPTV